MLKPSDRYIGQIKRENWFGLFGAHSIWSKKNPHQKVWVTIFPSLRFPGDRSWAKRAREVQSSIQVPGFFKQNKIHRGQFWRIFLVSFFYEKKKNTSKRNWCNKEFCSGGKVGILVDLFLLNMFFRPSKTCQSLDSFFVRGSQQRNGKRQKKNGRSKYTFGRQP